MDDATICALATPPGRAVRTSGSKAFEAARTLAGVEVEPRRVTAVRLKVAGGAVPAEVDAFRGTVWTEDQLSPKSP